MNPRTREPLRLAVLLSGGGRTMANLAESIASGELPAQITVVISSRADAYGVQRAQQLGLSAVIVPRREFKTSSEFSDVVWQHIRAARADLVCLAGFLSMIDISDDYARRVINIHPALLPSFGGKGMYGHHVHEAVLAAGCKVSGCTVHFCDQHYDTGPILVQRACEVREDDTPDTLAARVFEQECIAFPHAIRLIADGRVAWDGQKVRIIPENEP